MTDNKKLKFSVVIPVYNMEETIGDAIASVLNQTYQSFEIIVQDNNSRDNTAKVVKKFIDPRIRYYKNKVDIGYRNNLIAGWKNCSGEILYYLSADDILSIVEIKGYLETEVSARGVRLAGLEHMDERYLRAVGYTTKSRRAELPKMVLFGDIVGEDDAAGRAPRAKWCASPTRAAAKASLRQAPRRARSSGSTGRERQRSPVTPTPSSSMRTW